MLFKQIRNATTGAYSYLLGDSDNRVGVVVDPVAESRDVLLALSDDLGFDLCMILLTHVHSADDGSALSLRSRTGGIVVVSSACDFAGADMRVEHGARLKFGDETVSVIGTPGHTRCGACYHWRDRLFTGDTLLIGCCGGIALPDGDAGTLFDSVTARLFALPPETLIFPGLALDGRTVSTIAEERSSHPCFGNRSRDSAVALMAEAVRPRCMQTGMRS